MTDKEIEEGCIKYLGKYSPEFVAGAKWMQKQLDHIVEGANEAGELLAYNCEKRARKETADNACRLFKNSLMLVMAMAGVKVWEEDEEKSIDELAAAFRKELEENK